MNKQVVVAGIGLAAWWFASGWCTPRAEAQANGRQFSTGMSAAEQRASGALVEAANQDRAANNLAPLRADAELTTAAWKHAQLMVNSGGLSHQLPGEPGLIARIQQAGVHCTTVAENVADAPSAAQINNEWMHSPPHRANLLDPRVNAIGVAVVIRGGQMYAVEDFARELSALTPAQQERQVGSLLHSRGLAVEQGGSIARAYCDRSPRHVRPLPKLVMRYSTADLSRLPRQIEQGIASGAYRRADVAACAAASENGFAAYQIVILLY